MVDLLAAGMWLGAAVYAKKVLEGLKANDIARSNRVSEIDCAIFGYRDSQHDCGNCDFVHVASKFLSESSGDVGSEN